MPPVVGLLRWAYTLGITHVAPSTHDWFYSNFIQLTANADFLERHTELFVDFWRGGQNELHSNNPYLSCRNLDYQILERQFLPDLYKISCDFIRDGYYPVYFVNEAVFPHSVAFGDEAFPHHVLIYGFDTARRVYQVAGIGFTTPARNLTRYATFEVSFDQMHAAMTSMAAIIRAGGCHDQGSYLLKLRIDDVIDYPHGYPLNLAFICDSLDDYLKGEAGYGRHNFNLAHQVFGLDVYAVMDQYLQAASTQRLHKRFDTRHVHLLGEHKKVMLERLAYLEARLPQLDLSAERRQLEVLISQLNKIKMQCLIDIHELHGSRIESTRAALRAIALLDAAVVAAIRERLLPFAAAPARPRVRAVH